MAELSPLSPRHRAMVEKAKRWRFLTEHRNTPQVVVDAYREWCEAERRPAVTALVDRATNRAGVIVRLPAGVVFDEDETGLDHLGFGDAWWGGDRTWVGSDWIPPDDALRLAWRVGEWWDGRESEGGE